MRPVDAHLRVVERFALSPERLWDVAAGALPMGIADLTFPVFDEITITRVERRASASGAAQGTEWHCYHGPQGERVTFLRIVAHDRTRLVTVHAGGADRYYATARLVPTEGGTTVDVCFEWEEPPDPALVETYRVAVERQMAKVRDRRTAGAGGRAAPLDRLPEAPASAASVLTPREREVAALVARGSTNRAIAEALVISERTVETHIEHIMDKLGVRARSEIAVWAVTSGLVSAAARPQG